MGIRRKIQDLESNFITGITRFNCGEQGHAWRECPKEYMGGRSGQTAHGRDGNRGRENGCFPGGRGTSSFLNPPRPRQPHIRQQAPITEQWCGICGVRGTHATK